MIYTVEPLDRVMLELGPFTIYWYGVIIAFGALLGIYLAMKEAERLGWNKDTIIDFVVYAIPIAIITARIFYVTFEWERYAGGPFWKVFAIWEGGIAIHGAVLGGVLTAIVYSRMKKLSFWKLADIMAPSLILGQAIGRWGNFMNQEAHGEAVSEAAYNNFLQYLPDFIMNQMTIEGVMYHPTFLYESIWNILVFVFLLLLRKYNPTRGVIFLNYLIFYSVGRFFIEGMRTDSLYIIEGLRTAQVVSAMLIVLGIILIIYRRKTESARYLDLPEPKKGRKNKKKKR
ncbi:prolipoprotein diacylglyceryl transferase [Oceanobacillus alkalisoli]|uniref:prolipoprotein diacylglyceryl transferase n=1 Tax=Oceanobacillus alkalisoli TaxID=2925113 RepID=UPI001EEFC41A|nr:prolipoprotein diacylglyceryl transferase [Oceanobacillus alkalisoli]MCF3942150.1 prolipoprotein diacylglyceryl transferase [Oceanobacillus alkalisoli]MCG5104384.1 prolipoprotein diacylglyceryl transferase [Oceanobacillus alkalisoli]